MDEDEYQAGLAKLRADWGGVYVNAHALGYLIAEKDPTTGILVGSRSRLIAEIINRALAT